MWGSPDQLFNISWISLNTVAEAECMTGVLACSEGHLSETTHPSSRGRVDHCQGWGGGGGVYGRDAGTGVIMGWMGMAQPYNIDYALGVDASVCLI